jgi:nickel transport protein
MRLFSLIPALACAAALSLPAQAHNVWLEPDSGGGYVVQFGGHEGVLETFRPEKLKSVQAFDQRGRSIPVKIEPREGGVHVRPERQAAMLAVHFDNGYFSRAGDGPMVEKPMNENPGATSGVHAVWPTRRRTRASRCACRRCWTASRPRASASHTARKARPSRPQPTARPR